jgi:glucose/arabinose dehydrogenase
MSMRIGMAAAAAILAPALVAVVAILSQAATNPPAAPPACSAGTGITLPPGFCATIFADNLGNARHLAVAPNGTVYVNTLGGPSSASGFLVALRDTKGQGRADVVQRFGAGAPGGGTGIAFYKGAIFAEMRDRILRYPLPAGAILPNGAPQMVVSGLPITGDHPMHPFVISAQGTLYIDVASATNSCQLKNRVANSPGDKPCDELLTRAGIWRYDANKTGQHFSTAERFVKGLRNGEGLTFDSAGRLYATQHGRDQLYENWPSLYKPAQGQNLPGEEIVILRLGADYGWPECYFDLIQKKLVLAPEYGGDGGKLVSVCAQMQAPLVSFPAHWAPNDMVIYNATQFPQSYRGGAFIAFHGSWNRAPGPQGGYFVVFLPLANGKVGGPAFGFADGFAGATKEPGKAAFRPTGLAVGPDGALYISDDVHGRIWRVVYKGSGG